MPSWNIHLEAGERLAKKLKLTHKEKQEFLLGCLLPDINNGYVNNPAVIKEHRKTHYAYDEKSSLNFYAENKRQVDEKQPIFLGYIFHLFTDGFFNYEFFHRAKRDENIKDLSHEAKNDIKHHDYWLFDTKYHHELDIPESEYKDYIKKANQINVVDINETDLGEIVKIMHDDALNDFVEGEEYLFYTEAELEELMNRMVEGFSEQYLGENYA